MNTCYIVYLKGMHVHGGYSIQGVISNISMDYIFRKDIKNNYGIEFEKYSPILPGYWEFKNITDGRDVTLCIVRSKFKREEH